MFKTFVTLPRNCNRAVIDLAMIVCSLLAPEVAAASVDCGPRKAEAQQELSWSAFSRAYRDGLFEARAAAIRSEPDALLAAAERGNVAAMSFLVIAYSGIATPFRSSLSKDDALARKWADAAAERGAPDGWSTLGSALKMQGRLREAKEYYERAAQAGSVEAKYQLMVLLSHSLPATQQRFNTLLREGMAAGDYRFALVLTDTGLRFEGDFEQAEQALKKGAGACSAEAMRGLGQLYLQRGNPEKALPWLEQAFSERNQLAAYRLAAAFSGKYGVPADFEKYALWLNRVKSSLKAAPAPFVFDALEKHAGPVLLDDGTTVEILHWGDGWYVQTVTASGFIDLRSATKKIEIIDTTRRANNIQLQLYTCGKQRGRPDLARLDQLNAAGRYMEAIIELRKDCEDLSARKWLAAKSSEGYAPFEIEYADWLRRSGDAQATYLYALGVTRLFEDAVVCEDSTAQEDAAAVGTKYEDLAREVSSIVPETRRALFARAASESEKIGVAGSPDYVCYHGWTFKIRDAKES